MLVWTLHNATVGKTCGVVLCFRDVQNVHMPVLCLSQNKHVSAKGSSLVINHPVKVLTKGAVS
jgi:hypothetical protein